MSNQQPTITTGNGDCFKAAYVLAMELDHPGIELCHGLVRGRSNMKGETFWHAWVEIGGVCFDFSNGRRASLPIDRYYVLCAINAHQVRHYDRDTAWKEAQRTGICGPWD